MSFLRPEAVAFLRRYAEPAIYAVIAVILLSEGFAMVRNQAWLGWVVLIIGAIPTLAVIGRLERDLIARRVKHPGPGVVSIQEGRITYFGPLGGAVVAIDALTRIAIVTNDRGPFEDDVFWELTDEAGLCLLVPTGAENAAELLDVFGLLPGFNTMAVLQAMGSTGIDRVEIWSRNTQFEAVSSS